MKSLTAATVILAASMGSAAQAMGDFSEAMRGTRRAIWSSAGVSNSAKSGRKAKDRAKAKLAYRSKREQRKGKK